MNNGLQQFLAMGGYGWYVWGSYGIVIAMLFVQWLLPWHKYKRYKKKILASQK